MLIYHPAFDAYHCTFRMLLLSEMFGEMEKDRAFLFDFYLAFPGATELIKLPREHTKSKKVLRELKNPYRDPVNAKRTLDDIHEIQQTSLRCLAGAGLIVPELLTRGSVKRTAVEMEKAIQAKLNNLRERERVVLEFMSDVLVQLPLLGPGGLKDRTGLMEHRYDLV